MPLKVVIVEDNPSTIHSLMQTIRWAALDCEIVGTASDGESGYKLILRESPDIVLTDIRMPRMDGLDMITQVRQQLPDCKIIIITGYDQFQYASRAIKLAVFDYILKPIDNPELERTISRAAAMMRSKLEVDVALDLAKTLKRRAQMLSLLTNESQRGLGVGGNAGRCGNYIFRLLCDGCATDGRACVLPGHAQSHRYRDGPHEYQRRHIAAL